jgi:mRNA-degrading endonuclease toxin of MazEF toxin-antitoxin module/mannose-6-phosphate isomerase-like protein (cupin superfamily)
MDSAHRPIRSGDLYWIADEPDRDTCPAHPYVVVQDDVFNSSRITTVVVCALTSRLSRAQEPGNVLLSPGEGGLPQQSVVVVSQIASVERARLGERIGGLSPARVEEILRGLRFQQRAFFGEPAAPATESESRASQGQGQALDLREKLAQLVDLWSPRVISELNDYQIKLVKLQGDFVWHVHEHTDELFLVLHGRMTIEFRDRSVELGAGQLCVGPRGVEQLTRAGEECHALLIEPRGVVNTGDERGPLTAPIDKWL